MSLLWLRLLGTPVCHGHDGKKKKVIQNPLRSEDIEKGWERDDREDPSPLSFRQWGFAFLLLHDCLSVKKWKGQAVFYFISFYLIFLYFSLDLV